MGASEPSELGQQVAGQRPGRPFGLHPAAPSPVWGLRVASCLHTLLLSRSLEQVLARSITARGPQLSPLWSLLLLPSLCSTSLHPSAQAEAAQRFCTGTRRGSASQRQRLLPHSSPLTHGWLPGRDLGPAALGNPAPLPSRGPSGLCCGPLVKALGPLFLGGLSPPGPIGQ